MVRTKVADRGRRFALESPLGAGGHGEVWLAYDRLLGRKVALKRIRQGSGIDDDALRHEARLLARLNHPNIVAIYDLAEVDGDAYLVLEHVRGRSLRELLADGPVSEAQALAIGRQAADALASAHAAGVIHNDVKPDNILIDEAGNARLTDFGISRFDGATLAPADAQQLFGTLAYIAPEVLQGDRPTPASDVYALGVTLREAVSGQSPRANVGVSVYEPATADASPAASVSAGLAAALDRATRPTAALRFDSAAAFSEALAGATRTQTRELPRALAAIAPRRRLRVPAVVLGLAISLAGVGLLLAAANLTTANPDGGGATPTAAASATPRDAAGAPPATATVRPAPTNSPTPAQASGPPGRNKKPPGKDKDGD
jgi:serine/threonine protein kinase